MGGYRAVMFKPHHGTVRWPWRATEVEAWTDLWRERDVPFQAMAYPTR